MGVDARRALILTGTVVSTVLVLVFFAGAASAQCTAMPITFTVNSSTGSIGSDAQWPGGMAPPGTAPCEVPVTRPSGGILLAGTLGESWGMVSFGRGFLSCSLTGVCNPNGGFCSDLMPCVGVDAPSTCPAVLFQGIPNCNSDRPSCSLGFNGNATASAHVQC